MLQKNVNNNTKPISPNQGPVDPGHNSTYDHVQTLDDSMDRVIEELGSL